MMGTLSPVNMLSFMIALPVNIIKSQGRIILLGTSMISPGTNHTLLTSIKPLLSP